MCGGFFPETCLFNTNTLTAAIKEMRLISSFFSYLTLIVLRSLPLLDVDRAVALIGPLCCSVSGGTGFFVH